MAFGVKAVILSRALKIWSGSYPASNALKTMGAISSGPVRGLGFCLFHQDVARLCA